LNDVNKDIIIKIINETNINMDNTLMDLLLEYCKIDRILLAEILKRFFISYKTIFNFIPNIKYFITAPRIREITFLNIKSPLNNELFYEKGGIEYISPIRKNYKFVKKGYHGGRTEIFQIFTDKKYVLNFDVNRMYGNCIKLPLPIGSGIMYDEINPSEKSINDFIKFIEDENKIGFL
jgi:hypothetical protein